MTNPQNSISSRWQDNDKDLMALADHAVSLGSSLGAEGVIVGLSAGEDKKIVFENKEFSQCHSLESRNIGIGVHRSQKKGSASTNSPSEDSVGRAINKAVSLSEFGIADPHLSLATPEQAPAAAALDFLYDPAVENMTLGELDSTLKEGMEELLKDPRVAIDRMEAGINTSYHGMANGHGVKQREFQTSIYWSLLGMAKEGDVVGGMDYTGGSCYGVKDFKPRFLADMKKFRERVLANLNPTSCPSYNGAVLFTPRAVEELIVSQLLFHCYGSQIMDGKSRWAEKLGEQVMSPKLSLVDRPHNPERQGATSYDSDGLPTKERDIVRDGVLKCHLYSCYSAKKLGKEPNGTAGGPFCLDVLEGDSALQDLKSPEQPLLMIDRFSGNTDPLTGDFSGVAKSSAVIRPDGSQQAVTETMVAGNLFEILGNIAAVSKETDVLHYQFSSPYLLVDGISVTGS